MPRTVEIVADSGRKPRSVERLRDWEYVERQMHRLICAWGRYFADWQDKIVVHRQVWEQAECVRRLRSRLAQFPGAAANLDQPVSAALERLTNTVLLAPSHQDAAEGIYGLLNRLLVKAYADYATRAHPVHDAPTLELLNEVITIKEGMRLWLRDYRRRFPHTIEKSYAERIECAAADCGWLLEPLAVGVEAAQPAGVHTGFRLPRWPARPAGTVVKHNDWPFIDADFCTRVETRRLFWCMGYMREMNLAMDQLRWLYDSPAMPWEFHHDISRHLWDESRHGDSGCSRLADFGITLAEVGFGSYQGDEPLAGRAPLYPQAGQNQPGALPAAEAAAPLSGAELYEQVFHIGMVAETGHFQVKREAYDDFKAGGDLESAEMMLFDIIDEQTHVQYAHRWLPVLAQHAGVDHSGYRERAAEVRRKLQEEKCQAEAKAKALPRDVNDPAFALYQRLLDTMRRFKPLSNAGDRSPRSMLPM
ncbi:MAG: hypothetical protein WD042_02815 [Phycisphaeraceae bacterium]